MKPEQGNYVCFRFNTYKKCGFLTLLIPHAWSRITSLVRISNADTHTEYDKYCNNTIMKKQSTFILRVMSLLLFFDQRSSLKRPRPSKLRVWRVKSALVNTNHMHTTAYPYNGRSVCECKDTKNFIFLLSHSSKSAVLQFFNY